MLQYSALLSSRPQVDDDTFETPGTICCCFPFGGCPCLPICGIGPCAAAPKFKRSPDDPNAFIGQGAIYKGGFCGTCFSNKGDVQIGYDGGKYWDYIPMSVSAPPCFKGTTMGCLLYTSPSPRDS